MRYLTRLERSKDLWILLLFFILFFFLRLPSLIEPHWYGDEGVYDTIALGLNQGKLLYQDIWDNKPPLLYLTYAVFHADQFWVRLASLITGALSIISFYFLAKEIFGKNKPTILATSIYILFFGLPIIEGNIANAENFMLLPIVTAGYFIYKTSNTTTQYISKNTILFVSGFLLGIAFLYKIVALFDFITFAAFLSILNLPQEINLTKWKLVINHVIKRITHLLLGFITPFGISLIYFLLKGGLGEYIQAIFFSTVGYVGIHNQFLFPQGLLITKILLILLFSLFIVWKREKIQKPLLFIGLWIGWSLFNAYFSNRPYTHYLLVLLPSFSLLVGLLFSDYLKKRWTVVTIIIILFLAHYSFNYWNPIKTSMYYENFVSFIRKNKTVDEYQAFFDPRVPHDMTIVSYLNSHLEEKDSIFLWGDNPQIYALVNRTPPGRFTVAYHIISSEENIAETKKALEESKPKYIILTPGLQSIPFPMYNYSHTITLNNTEIYERLD